MSRAPNPELRFAVTPAGWALSHSHYQGPPGAPTVILSGGYGCNRHFMDFKQLSLARHLNAQGLDVWVAELRGRGLSHATPMCARPTTWNFDELATIDVPTLIAYVRRAGAGPICWLGHSMGGMAGYAHLSTATREETMPDALVTIASPIEFPVLKTPKLSRLAYKAIHLPLPKRQIPLRDAAARAWPWLIKTNLVSLAFNIDNIDPRLAMQASLDSFSNVPQEKLLQMAGWALSRKFESADGSVDYRAKLAGAHTPSLLISGAGDKMGTPVGVAAALNALGSSNKRHVVFSRINGYSADYGHLDLVLGRRASEEVFPVVGEWILETLS